MKKRKRVKQKLAGKTTTGSTRQCLLCSSRSFVQGCYVPHGEKERATLKVPDGKIRTYWYGLCKKCVNTPRVTNRVEWKILSSPQLMGWTETDETTT